MIPNKKIKVMLGTILLLFLILIPNTSADSGIISKPSLILTAGNLTLNSPIFITGAPVNAHKVNVSLNTRIQLYNQSTGSIIDDDTSMFCIVNLYRPTDNAMLVLANMSLNTNNIEWNYTILGHNFSETGQYVTLFYCQYTGVNGTYGGTAGFSFEVTNNGKIFEMPEALTYFILLLGVFLLFTLSLYLTVVTPFKNTKNEKGSIIYIVNAKYVKLGLIMLTWLLLVWILNILVGLSANFVSLSLYYGFFGFMFESMSRLTFFVGLGILGIGLYNIIRDLNLKKQIKNFGSAD